MVKAGEILVAGSKAAIALNVVNKASLQALSKMVKTQARALGFEATPGSVVPVIENGVIAQILVGEPAAETDPFALGAISSKLPAGVYAFSSVPKNAHLVCLGFALELYRYSLWRTQAKFKVQLVIPDGVDVDLLLAEVEASFWVRDMINGPANVFGPNELEAQAKECADTHKARFSVTTGKTLAKEFPLIHAVGAASSRAPRLIDFTWGKPTHPKVTLVGKGVCFDTGGLDIKPASGMALMKKDMGGAATVLGLAHLVMAAKLPVRLRVLLPVVENAIAGNAFRPGDVFKSRKGLSIEIGNTDAEGRLILADALTLADEEAPDLLIDMATLTGAARVALGPDLPPFYTDDHELAAQLLHQATACNDPLWQLPLWRPYYSLIESSIADLNNAGSGGFAGSITAALFLRRFVDKARAYAHFDIFAWTPTAKPGRPKGGEAQAMRALFAVISARYGGMRQSVSTLAKQFRQ